MTDNTLSPALVRRLPAYFRTLIRLYGEGKERISSDELSAELGLAPSQVRSDMKAIGCQGQRSYGYGIPSLYKRIADILQLSDRFSAVVIGDTHIASAIASEQIFLKRGLKLICRFSDGEDVSEGLAAFSGFKSFFSQRRPNIIITAGNSKSAVSALSVAEAFADENVVTEIWNFTETQLSSDTVKVKNIHLSDQLMLLMLEIGK